MQPQIRPYRSGDLDAVYDICVRTAEAGADGRGRYSSDRLVGDIFAAPYVTLEPELAHVLDDGTGLAVGYVLGTADTARFVRRYRAEWLPAVDSRYGNDPRDQAMLSLHHDPERMLVPELADYPAHLHIDLLPEAQGKGFGRGLMTAFLRDLRAAGVARVHLGMVPTNTAARAFYDRLGFTELVVPEAGNVTYLGRTTE
ncbi:GNAT family N-acetyltransferase [Micromonosporaceae bacterium Da 78-11]